MLSLKVSLSLSLSLSLSFSLPLSLSLLSPSLPFSPLSPLSLLPPFSYPAALVVPEKVTDDSLAAVASQFQHQRLPVVTWKHPNKKVVLLRSSSFVPCSIAKKSVSSSALAGIRHPSVAKQAKIAAANAASGWCSNICCKSSINTVPKNNSRYKNYTYSKYPLLYNIDCMYIDAKI